MTFVFSFLLLAGILGCLFLFRKGSAPAGLGALVLVAMLAGLCLRSMLRSRDAPYERLALDTQVALGQGAGALVRSLRVGTGPVVVLDVPSDIPLVEEARQARRRGLAQSLRDVPVIDADLVGLDARILASTSEDDQDPLILAHILQRHADASAVVSFVGLPRRLGPSTIPFVAYPAPRTAAWAEALLREGRVAALISYAPLPQPFAPPAPGRDPATTFAARYAVKTSPRWPPSPQNAP